MEKSLQVQLDKKREKEVHMSYDEFIRECKGRNLPTDGLLKPTNWEKSWRVFSGPCIVFPSSTWFNERPQLGPVSGSACGALLNSVKYCTLLQTGAPLLFYAYIMWHSVMLSQFRKYLIPQSSWHKDGIHLTCHAPLTSRLILVPYTQRKKKGISAPSTLSVRLLPMATQSK